MAGLNLTLSLDPNATALLERLTVALEKNNELCEATYDMWDQVKQQKPGTAAGDVSGKDAGGEGKAPKKKAAKKKAAKKPKPDAQAAADDLSGELEQGLDDPDGLLGGDVVYTFDDVKAKIVEVAKTFDRNKATDIMADFDAEKTDQLKEEDYAAVVAACDKLLNGDDEGDL